jgi:eukaryotic-like serine/threonine-protein kinase
VSGAVDSLVGRVLGGTYRVERKIGEGGMGAVFAARNVRTGKPYAVKVLLPELGRRKEAIARFEREARALAALGHAGIVGIHDFATESDGLAFLVMDQLEGEELGARIKRDGRLSPEHAVHLALEIASALAAAHALGIVHRDLKPSNVFLTRRDGQDERAVLLDFGLARSVHGGEEEGLGKVTASGVVMGTPHYMSPEQAQGRPVEARSDLYSLGAILFEMLSGRPPFEGPSLAMLFALLVTTDAPTLASLGVSVDPALDALVHACLEKDPARRPASAADLVKRLSQFPHRASVDGGGPRGSFPRTVASRELAESPTIPGLPAAQSSPATRVSASDPELTPRARRASGGALMGGGLALVVVLIVAIQGVLMLTHRVVSTRVRTAIDAPATAPRDAGVDAFHGLPDAWMVPTIDAGHDAAIEARAPRGRVPRVVPVLEAPPVAPAGPPGVPAPPGMDRIQAAAARLEVSDYAGCLRELRSAPETAQVLGMRMSCAHSAGDDRALAATCASLHAHFPAHGYTRACDAMLPP